MAAPASGVRLLRAEVEVRSGDHDTARQVIGDILSSGISGAADMLEHLWELAVSRSSDAEALLEMGVAHAVRAEDWTLAADMLRAFDARVPGRLSAAERLVEVVTAGALGDDALSDAQGRLADARLAAGDLAGASAMARDLLEKRPSDVLNAVRCRRVLEALEASGASAPPALAASDAERPPPPPDLDEVFAGFRAQVVRQAPDDVGEAELARGLALHAAGDLDGCVASLRTAARVPHLRFRAASQVARVFRQRGQVREAIEWFEVAAAADAPTVVDGYLLLYDLAGTLELAGEPARALAVYLELRSTAGDYRDVRARIDQLAALQAPG
jgi:tetratricopeptide (TPR) repeat protein